MEKPINQTFTFLAVAAITLALALSGCGKKGDPGPPDGKQHEFPRQYPDPASL